MKAIRVHEFGGPEKLKWVEVPDPVCGPGQLRLKIKAVGVNPVETYIRSGLFPVKPSLPYTPGTDAAGVVDAVGPQVTAWKPGDRVYTTGSVSGTYAEFCLCQSAQVRMLPEGISYSEGASLGIPYATAVQALLMKARAEQDEIVLIHGATGGVGIAAVQVSRRLGLRVIGTGGTEEGRQLLLRERVQAVDHGQADY